MKLLAKVSSFIILVFLFLFFSLHIFVNIRGRALLASKLRHTFKREISIGQIKTKLPFDLVINDLEAKDFFKIDEVTARGGIFDIFSGNLVLSELRLKHPVVNLGKSAKIKPQTESQASPVDQNGQSSDKNSTAADNNTLVAATAIWDKELPRIILKRAIVAEGVFNLRDDSVGDNGIRVSVRDVNIKIENLYLPVLGPGITSFEISGKVPWQNMKEDGKIQLSGWINFLKRDMRAVLKIEDIDGVYLYPYYSSWLNLERSRIQKAKLNFKSEIQGFNNDVTADCHLELTQIEFKPREEQKEPDRLEKITHVVLDIFKAMNQGKVVLDFKFKTKMDSPEFGLAPIIKLALKEKITQGRRKEALKPKDMVQMPAKVIKGTVLTAGDVARGLLKTAFSIGQELKKAIESSFKKEDNNSLNINKSK